MDSVDSRRGLRGGEAWNVGGIRIPEAYPESIESSRCKSEAPYSGETNVMGGTEALRSIGDRSPEDGREEVGCDDGGRGN